MPRWEINTKKGRFYTGDLFEANKMLKEKNASKFSIWHKSVNVSVNLKNGTVWVNNKKYEFNLPSGTEFRWINFRRVEYQMTLATAPVFKGASYYVGWQATVNGKNVKVIVKINEEGEWDIETQGVDI